MQIRLQLYFKEVNPSTLGEVTSTTHLKIKYYNFIYEVVTLCADLVGAEVDVIPEKVKAKAQTSMYVLRKPRLKTKTAQRDLYPLRQDWSFKYQFHMVTSYPSISTIIQHAL